MKIWLVQFAIALAFTWPVTGQTARENIYSSFALFSKRTQLQKELREQTIGATFAMPLDSDNEHKFESACLAISQFQFRGDDIKDGLGRMLNQYDELQYDTRRALLEAVYAVYPHQFQEEIEKVMGTETYPKLFAMCAAYRFRADPSVENSNAIKISMVEQFPHYDSLDLLLELEKYLNHSLQQKKNATPPLKDLVEYYRNSGRKVIYSFQRWNRDYPGMAIVQQANGQLMRHPDGRLMIFEQLARSASDLPYFITNGSTPQGIYSIRGTAVSGNNFIGPTPNLQLLMPYEGKWEQYFQLPTDAIWDTTKNVLDLYHELLPASWRNYAPIHEVFYAGLIGRSEIIAHGTTIDPQYFIDKPYYPLTPTMGCLCAKEIWNVTNGKLLISEQFNLVSAFTATPGSKGLLVVINLDDQQKPVTRAELEQRLK